MKMNAALHMRNHVGPLCPATEVKKPQLSHWGRNYRFLQPRLGPHRSALPRPVASAARPRHQRLLTSVARPPPHPASLRSRRAPPCLGERTACRLSYRATTLGRARLGEPPSPCHCRTRRSRGIVAGPLPTSARHCARPLMPSHHAAGARPSTHPLICRLQPCASSACTAHWPVAIRCSMSGYG